MSRHTDKDMNYFFASFYHFTELENLPRLRDEFLSYRGDILGLIILADEGINGTIAGSREIVTSFVSRLCGKLGLDEEHVKHSQAVMKRKPFRRLKIKIKDEIVTSGIPNLDVEKFKGTYVEPDNWNEFINDPDVLLVDVRNVYEHRIGTFAGARDPKTLNFRQFPQAIERIISEEQPEKIAMFCTGGIRCEKASAYLRQRGFDNVYHLHGGVIRYLEQISAKNSLWNGKCFVFDGRITVNHNLEAEPEPLCRVCGQVMLKVPESGEYECYQCIEYPMKSGTEQ
ncbi:MAG: rhodanese-related sulfurtransferase [Salinispira sp.]